MGKTVENAGCPIAYDVAGGGTPILFIQGVGTQGAGWRPQTDFFSARFTCATFDNRGFGKSVPMGPGKLTIEQMADDARAVMDALGWESAHVVGHSMGGLIAQHLALTIPQRVRSLALLCTFREGRAAAPLSFRMLWYGLRARVGTRRMRRRGFLKLVLPPGTTEDLDATAERFAELFGHDLAANLPIVGEQLTAMRATPASGRLSTLASIRTLVVSATHDPIAPPKAGKALSASIPNSRYVEFPEASHSMPITHADKLNALLDEHFTAAS